MPLLMCPNCQASMQAVQRSGVEFDMCPNCRGVWLDRGELEKLVGFARDPDQPPPQTQHQPQAQPSYPAQPTYQPRPPKQPDYHGRHYDDDDDDYKYRGKKKRGFDIFDIFD